VTADATLALLCLAGTLAVAVVWWRRPAARPSWRWVYAGPLLPVLAAGLAGVAGGYCWGYAAADGSIDRRGGMSVETRRQARAFLADLGAVHGLRDATGGP